MASKFKGRIRTAVIGLAIVSALQASLMIAGKYYTIGFDGQKGVRSTPHTMFLIVKSDRAPVVGDYFSFETDDRHQPWFNKIKMVKRVAGQPGDKVAIVDDQLTINGEVVARRNPRIIQKIADAKPGYELSFPVEVVVPPGHYVMVTDSFDGFDSRYWGLLDESAIRGRAVPVF